MKKRKKYIYSLLILGILVGCTSNPNDVMNEKPIDMNHENDSTIGNIEVPSVTPELGGVFEDKQDEKERPTQVEAVFLNSIPLRNFGSLTEDEIDKSGFLVNPSTFDYRYSGDYTQVVSPFEYDENDDKLYAFWVRMGNYVGETPEDTPLQDDYETKEDYMSALNIYDYNKLFDAVKETEIFIVEKYPYTVKGGFIESLENYNNENGVLAPAVVGKLKELKKVFGSGETVNGRNYQLLPATRPDIGELAKNQGYTGEITMFTFEDIAGTEKYVTVTIEVK